jgi:hypothetical protein
VNGDGLSLRIRLRKDVPVTADEMSALPPVPGFLDPPLADVGPPPAPLTDANYNLWSIELEDVDAIHVRELWIDTVRYAGDLEIRGRWLFRPLRWLDVGPAEIRLRALEVGYGSVEPWLSGATGELTATVHPFALQDVQGAAMLDQISIAGNVLGRLQVGSILDRALAAPDPGVAAAGRTEDALIDARVHLDHGVLRPGTAVRLDPFSAIVRTGALRVEASVTAQAHIDDDGVGHLGVWGADFRATQGTSESVRAKSLAVNLASRDLDLARVGTSLDLGGSRVEGEGVVASVHGVSLSAPRVSVVATAARLQPGDEPPVRRLAVEVPDLELPLPLAPGAQGLLPEGVSIQGGRVRGSISADIDLERKAGAGHARLVAEDLHARAGDEALDGEVRLDVRAVESGGRTALSGSTLAFDGTVGGPPVAWWARVTMREGVLDARSGLRLRAQVTANAKDASPLAAFVAKNTAIPRWVVGAISTTGFVASGEILVAPSTFQARAVSAHATGIDLGFELARLGAEKEWALLVDVGPVCAGIDVSGSQTDVLLFGAKPWFEKKTASLRGVERRYE